MCGRRRATPRPAAVTNTVSANVQRADGAAHDAACCADSSQCAANKTRSRNSVKTNSEEKNPMDRTPTQANRSFTAGLRNAWLRRESGMTTQQAIRNAMPAHTPMGPIESAGNSRQPIYPGSESNIHRGFKSTRRTVTNLMVGRNSPGSRPPRLAQRFHPLEFDELGRRCPQVVAVQEGFERGGAVHVQRADLGVGARLVEKWDGHALAAGADHAMFGCPDSTAAPSLEHLAEIDRQAVVARRHVDPCTIAVARLQSRDAILGQERQKS